MAFVQSSVCLAECGRPVFIVGKVSFPRHLRHAPGRRTFQQWLLRHRAQIRDGPEDDNTTSVSSGSAKTQQPNGPLEVESSADVLPNTNEASKDSGDWINSLPTSPTTTAVILLNAVAVVWGSQHAVIRQLIDGGLPAELVNLLRFTLAALVVAPKLPEAFSSDRSEAFRSETLAAGAELALWMFVGYALQSVGLITTTASRSGFLLYLNVKMVPILAWLVERRQIARETWISAGLALTGTFLLVSSSMQDAAGQTISLGPNVGDLWSIGAAAASACFIFRLEKRMQSTVAQLEPASVNAVSLAAVTVMCLGWVAADTTAGSLAVADFEGYASDWRQWLPGIVYLGVITTAVSNWMQAVGQKYVSAQKAAIIYALDPVYGAGFAGLLLGERLGTQGLVGAGVITIAALINQKTD